MFNKEQLQRFSIRKLTVGAASVLIGVSLMTEMNNNKVYADVRTTNENSNSQVHDNSDGNTLNLSTDLKSKADEAGTADSEVTNNSNAKVGGDGVTDNSNARNVEIKNIDDSKKDQQSGDAVAPKEKTANTIQKHEENVAKGTTVDSNDLQVTKVQADLAATKINGKASSVVSPQIKQIQAKYQTSKNPTLEKQINPTDRNSDGKVVVKAEDPSNYPSEWNNLIDKDRYIYQVLSLNNDPDTKLILSVNRNDSTDTNIYAYVIANNKKIKTATVGVNQKEIIKINKRGYQINNDGSSNIIIGDNKESTQNSSTVTSAPGYYTSDGGYYDWWGDYHPNNIYHPYSNVNPIKQSYGLGSTTSNDFSAIGEIIPIYTESSVIKYYYYDDNGDLQEFKDSDLSLHPNVVVTGLTGQEFKIPNVDQYKQVIPGFYLTSKDIPTNFTGTLSQFEEGKYYKKAYYNYDTDNVEYYSVYHQISPDGTMEVGVFDKNGNQIIVSDENGHKRPKLVEIKAGHHITFEFQIQDQTHFLTVRNPYVTAAPHEVQFIYKKLGSIIPVDENGTRIGDPIQFENDLTDPTKALPGIVPSISGYTPLYKHVGEKVYPNPTDPGENIEVVYSHDQQKAKVLFIDDTAKKTLDTHDLTGVTNGHESYSPSDEINQFVNKHYVLVSSDYPDNGFTYDNDNNHDQVFEIHLKHGIHDISDKKAITETITYKMSDDSKAPDKVEKQVEFSRVGKHDDVTNTDTWNAWQPNKQSFSEVPTPEVTGYTPDIKSVEAKTVTAGDNDITVTVTYNPGQQKAKVLFIDDTAKKTLDTHDLTGVTNGHESYSPSDEINQFVNKHYVLVSSDYPDNGFTYDNDNNHDQVFEVHLVHTYEPVETSQTITETVHYIDANGKPVAPDHVAKVVIKVTGTRDKVTDSIIWNTPSTGHFDEVISPEVPNMTPDKKLIPGRDIQYGDSDITESVVYTPDNSTSKTPEKPDKPSKEVSKIPEKPNKSSKEVSKAPEKSNKSSKEVSKAPEKSIDSRTVDNHVSAKSTAKRELPQTGATTNTGIWTGLVSMIASLGLLGASKRRKKN
ncbi:YSIRK signal domain/LPXTG anchor domain surface protein [Lactobacillus sp. OTU4228]|uniref:YSIRK signal domain/LPXTG anchor domain surface protein n=1 Tax=Lactobacillus sp. OTU4228 TaxID=1572760 RepID=UPI00069607D1|nr:YSIRK signal domain/LPXTG anchor domain surface protein [Lactobacillus sp. OTU4228]